MLVGAGSVPLALAAVTVIWVSPLSAIGAGVCVAAAAIALALNRAAPSATITATLAGAAAATSLGLTVLYPRPAGPADGVAAVAEAAGLLTLLLLSVRRLPAALAVCCGAVTSLAVSVLVLRLTPVDSVAEGAGMSLFGVVLAVGGAAVGAAGRRRSHRRQRRAVQARQAHRTALARDLHDFLGHDLSGILVQAQAAMAVADRDPDQQRLALRGIEVDAVRALSTLERTVKALYDADGGAAPDDVGEANTQPAPGMRDLPALVRRFNDSGTTRTELTMPAGIVEEVAADVGTTIFRVVVEALTNIRKHAPDASVATVTVTSTRQRSGRAVTVEVTDECPARQARPPVSRPAGLGLIGLRERVEATGGTFHAGPAGRSAWRVRAYFGEGAGAA